jgi:uncharacterized protein
LIDEAAILREVLAGYPLPAKGNHGVLHWARVRENGLRLAESTGADAEVVVLFSLFHDSCRFNEERDDGHGLRGAELARALRGSLVHLDDARFDLLFDACHLHTDGLTVGDPTLLACWDADRLDLARVGIRVKPERLCTGVGRSLIRWATERASRDHEETVVKEAWAFGG